MLETQVWLLYVGTVLLFMCTPGPSQLLMISVSLSNGFQKSMATAAGDLTANSVQMLLAGLGLATVLMSSSYTFSLIKWLGVAYLAWIGVKQIMASFNKGPGDLHSSATSLRKLWLRGFITSAANPKAVVFFAALFPQFIDPARDVLPQILQLGVTYLIIDGSFLLSYGKAACWLSSKINRSGKRLVDRVAGSGMIATAVVLSLKKNPSS